MTNTIFFMKEVNIDDQMIMIAAISEILKIRKKFPVFIGEEVLKEFAHSHIFYKKNNFQKVLMMAAASRAIGLIDKKPRLSDKEVMSAVVPELPRLIEKIDLEGAE